jgi:hypothetical protein
MARPLMQGSGVKSTRRRDENQLSRKGKFISVADN